MSNSERGSKLNKQLISNHTPPVPAQHRAPGSAVLLVIHYDIARRRPCRAAEEATITPNFKDADLRSVIEAVGEATGKSFIVDPRVRGEVTLTSSQSR